MDKKEKEEEGTRDEQRRDGCKAEEEMDRPFEDDGKYTMFALNCPLSTTHYPLRFSCCVPMRVGRLPVLFGLCVLLRAFGAE